MTNIVLNNGSSIQINGKTYSGNNVIINNGKVIIDGVNQDQIDEKIINVNIVGSVENMKYISGDVNVDGDVNNMKYISGNVHCNVANNMKYVSGSVKWNN